MTKTAQIEQRIKAAGQKGLSPRELRGISKQPHGLLTKLMERNRVERVKPGRYVIKGAGSLPAPKITVEPVKSRERREQELWGNFLSSRRAFRNAKQELYGFLAETR